MNLFKGIVLFVLMLSFNLSFGQNNLSPEDRQFIDRCDSLLVAHFRELDSFTWDTSELNLYNYDADHVPVVSDQTLMKRIEEMDENSPFDFVSNDASLAMIKLYVKKRYRLTSRMLGLSTLYFPIFETKLSAYHLPYELKYLPIVESALNPKAISRSGAGGLWQFMPPTGKDYGLQIGSMVDERFDPYLATEAACKYLSKLYAIFGDWSLALAAYNAGQGTVTKAIRRSGGKTDYWSIREFLPKETQNYVPAFIAVNYVMNYASHHNIYPKIPHFFEYEMDTIHVKERIDFGVMEEWLGYNRVKLAYLNPMYLTEVVPGKQGQPMPIKMPLELLGSFMDKHDSIVKYSSLEYKYWVAANKPARVELKHTVKSGETIESIAKHYHCTVQDIKAWNTMSKIKVKPGRNLVVFKLTSEPEDYKQKFTQQKAGEGDEQDVIVTDEEYIYHVVKSGDTLWDIAKTYNCSVDEILALNKEKDISTLHTGTKIKVVKR
ncbi:MAG: transglycosylase SLT domain-containing protein [Flavobacteriales bacterium]|nr:transglycosylase SLT domain-containing protein [Flavobacteriales bacterium]